MRPPNSNFSHCSYINITQANLGNCNIEVSRILLWAELSGKKKRLGRAKNHDKKFRLRRRVLGSTKAGLVKKKMARTAKLAGLCYRELKDIQTLRESREAELAAKRVEDIAQRSQSAFDDAQKERVRQKRRDEELKRDRKSREREVL